MIQGNEYVEKSTKKKKSFLTAGKNSMNTNLCRQSKRTKKIATSAILPTPTRKSDFKQQFFHNWIFTFI